MVNLYFAVAEGWRVDVNAAGDGGSNIDDATVDLLLAKTGLVVAHVRTSEEMPAK
jgi:hypothetical protein